MKGSSTKVQGEGGRRKGESKAKKEGREKQNKKLTNEVQLPAQS